MDKFILFLHILGAIGMGFYMLLPFLLNGAGKLSAEARLGFVSGLYQAGRIGQFLLIVQFLTGGYLISKEKYSVLWMVLILVLFLIVAAMTGMAGAKMKKFVKLGQDSAAAAQMAKAKMFSTIAAISFLVTVVLMAYPMYQG